MIFPLLEFNNQKESLGLQNAAHIVQYLFIGPYITYYTYNVNITLHKTALVLI